MTCSVDSSLSQRKQVTLTHFKIISVSLTKYSRNHPISAHRLLAPESYFLFFLFSLSFFRVSSDGLAPGPLTIDPLPHAP